MSKNISSSLYGVSLKLVSVEFDQEYLLFSITSHVADVEKI